MTRSSGILLIAVLAAACSRAPEPKQYEVKGQILGIKAEDREVLLKHEDIKNFMPAMTMPYKVQDAGLLAGKEPGDLVTATLVVGETEAHLSTMTKTGHAALETPPGGPEISTFDMVKTGEPVPDAQLVDEDGKPRPLSSYRGHRVALTFIYTRCPQPEFCPLMNQNFAAVQKAIKSMPELADVRLVSVSFDPGFDTPPVLKAQARTLGADPQLWHFVTGMPDDITKFAGQFGVSATRDASSPIIIHNLGTAVIDPEGRLVTLHSTNKWTPAELVAELTAAPAPRH